MLLSNILPYDLIVKKEDILLEVPNFNRWSMWNGLIDWYPDPDVKVFKHGRPLDECAE